MCEIKKLGNIYGFDGGNYGGNVYLIEGIAPAITNLSGGGNRQPMIVVADTQAHSYMGDTDICPTLVGIMGPGWGGMCQ